MNGKNKWLDHILHADEKQQKKLEAFFKEETTWCPEHVLSNFLAAFFLVLFTVFCVMPYQTWDFSSDDRALLFGMAYCGVLGFSFYLQKYNTFSMVGNYRRRVDELLQYLPVSNRQLHIFRLKKMIRLCIRLAGVTIGCQTLFTLAFMHTYSVINLLWPLLLVFIVPVGVAYLLFFLSHSRLQ